MEALTTKAINKNEALLRVEACWQQAEQMGRQDVERSAFENIINEIRSGDMDPLAGAEAAQQLLFSKQEY